MLSARFTARNGSFTGNVPQGWIVSDDDSIAPGLLCWLLKDDLSASITVQELRPDKATTQRVKDDGLKLLAAATAGFHDEAPVSVEPKEFEFHGRRYCSYETGKGANRKRYVLFESSGRYFECEAGAVKGEWRPSEIDRLFSVQQSVLATITK